MLALCRRLHDSWRDLADALRIPAYEQERFATGHEARQILAWLDARDRMADLPAALRQAGRADLLTLVPTPAPVEAADPGRTHPQIVTVRFDTHRLDTDLVEIYDDVLAGAGTPAVDVYDADDSPAARVNLHLVAHDARRVVRDPMCRTAVDRALEARRSDRSGLVEIILIGSAEDQEPARQHVEAWLGDDDPGRLFIRGIRSTDELAATIARNIERILNRSPRRRRSPAPPGDALYRNDLGYPNVGGY